MISTSTSNNETSPDTELLITQLMMQQRYKEVYELLSSQKSPQTAALYNMAICLHWSGNYQGALNRLDSIRLAPQINNLSQSTTNSDYHGIMHKQNQTNDYLNGMSEAYIKYFPVLAHDAIVRLKTDCWLKLRDYPKVIAIATPIAHKAYRDIIDALKLAETSR
ncbi:hypothetical protein ACFOWA_00985 [Pedobacter lithocola]|uniref:Tetratricopeptide repeat protein n=1 Tax=Pedobacter lithocola TaxID=1908239 RepID=A0ABV8P4B8_9SPHI